MSRSEIKVYRHLMGENDLWAEHTRELLLKRRLLMLNLIGSPGAGKTALLEAMVGRLAGKFRFAVLEGDVETTYDAERLVRIGIQASQLLTSGGCHLQARMVHQALLDLPLDALEVVVVENVGNLVCPAEFDLGEMGKVAVLSVTEGEDKPAKYPMLFREAKAVVLTKIDLIPYLPFKMERCMEFIRQVNGQVPVFPLSALKGEGVAPWIEWVAAQREGLGKGSA